MKFVKWLDIVLHNPLGISQKEVHWWEIKLWKPLVYVANNPPLYRFWVFNAQNVLNTLAIKPPWSHRSFFKNYSDFFFWLISFKLVERGYNTYHRKLSVCLSSCAKQNVLLSVSMISLWFPFCFGKDESTTCRTTVNLLPSQGAWSVAFIGCKQGDFLS